MAVAFDAKAVTVTTQGAPSSPITNSTLTTTGAASIVFGVFTSVTSASLASPIAMTWNGVAMSLVGTKLASDFLSSVYVYAIVSPATGNQTLSCTFTNGTGSQQVDLDCFSFKGSATASVAAAIPSANVISDASTPAGTVYPASAMTVTTINGDAAIAVANSVSTVLNGANVGTLINTEHASLVNYVSIYNLAVGSTTQVQFTDSGVNGFPCEALAFDLVQPASTASAGGAVMDAGTTFRRTFHYQSIAQPVVFTATPIITGWFNSFSVPIRPRIFLQQEDQQPLGSNSLATDNISWLKPFDAPVLRKTFPIPNWQFIAPQPAASLIPDWPDFIRSKASPLNYNPLAFVPTIITVQTVVQPWTQWPDFAPKKPPVANLWSPAFIPLVPTATVAGDWADFVRRKPQPLDTQPLGWASQTIAAPVPVMPWTNWPDFAPKKPRPTDLWPLAFVPIQPTASLIPDWPDFARGKPIAQDTQRFAWAPINITPAVPVMPWTSWPDFTRKTKPAADFPAVFFTVVLPDVAVIQDWPDFARAAARPLNYNPLAFVQTIAQPVTYTQWTRWPDFIVRAKPAADFVPWTFLAPTPITSLIPDWPDFARRRPQPIDTQPLAWVSQSIAASVPVMSWVQWPDFVRSKAVPLNYIPLALVQTVKAPWTQWTQWPDKIWRRPQPVDTGPFVAYLQLVKTPWNELSRWPDFVPIRTKAGLLATLQSFEARFPGTITQATVTGILAAFETNTDAAALAIYVRQSQPAVRAAVSIQEIGTI